VTRNHSLWDAVAVVLGPVLSTDEDIRAAEREQWDDRTNYLAVAPRVVMVMNATCLPTRCCAGMAIEVISVARHLGPTYKIMQGSVGCLQRA
jgi:arginine deiminase